MYLKESFKQISKKIRIFEINFNIFIYYSNTVSDTLLPPTAYYPPSIFLISFSSILTHYYPPMNSFEEQKKKHTYKHKIIKTLNKQFKKNLKIIKNI